MSDSSTSPLRAGYVLSIGMQKGGVSKTTNACHLAVALGEAGRRVLLWDVDENYGATKVFQIPPDAFFTTMSILTGDSTAEEAVLSFDDRELDVELPQNVDVIPSSRALQGVDRALSAKDKFYNPNECLSPAVEELKALGRYDYIIIDTGPQASPTTRSAYMVSDYFVLSLVPEKLAVDSLPDALEDIANALADNLPAPKLTARKSRRRRRKRKGQHSQGPAPQTSANGDAPTTPAEAPTERSEDAA